MINNPHGTEIASKYSSFQAILSLSLSLLGKIDDKLPWVFNQDSQDINILDKNVS